MLIGHVPLAHQIFDIISTCFLFLFVTLLVHDVLFAMPDRLLLLFHFINIIIIIIITIIITEGVTAQLVQ
jgi:hypothetical protein